MHVLVLAEMFLCHSPGCVWSSCCSSPHPEITLWQNVKCDIQDLISICVSITLSQCHHLYFPPFLAICFDFVSH